MSMKAVKRMFSVILVAALLLLTGCMRETESKSYDVIKFNGRDYVACGNTILLDSRLPGVTGWEDTRKLLLTEIGRVNRSTVYAVAGLDSNDWILCFFEPMIGFGPQGLYHSVDIKMESVADFMPDSLEVYALTPPTASGSGTEALYGSTSEQTAIDSVVKTILSGKELPPDAQLEAQKKAWSYDNSKQYRLEFKSRTFPNLRYLYDYTIGKDGKCYVLSEQAGFEADDSILNNIEPPQ